jgi:hypothetical protein
MHTKSFRSIKAAFAYHALMCVHIVIGCNTGQLQNCLLMLGIYNDGNENVGSLKKDPVGMLAGRRNGRSEYCNNTLGWYYVQVYYRCEVLTVKIPRHGIQTKCEENTGCGF